MGQEFQQRILLVDADLRRPTVQTLFGLGDGPGLSRRADGRGRARRRARHRCPSITSPCFLPALRRRIPRRCSARRRCDGCSTPLRTRFDRILIDMPPVAPLADLQIVAPLVDGAADDRPRRHHAEAGHRAARSPGSTCRRSSASCSTNQAAQWRPGRPTKVTGTSRGEGQTALELASAPEPESCSCSTGTSRLAA